MALMMTIVKLLPAWSLLLPVAGTAAPRLTTDPHQVVRRGQQADRETRRGRGKQDLGLRRHDHLLPGRQGPRPGVDGPPGGRPPRRRRAAPGRQRQRLGRGAQLLVVHKPALPAAHDPGGAGRGAGGRPARQQRPLGDRGRQVRGGSRRASPSRTPRAGTSCSSSTRRGTTRWGPAPRWWSPRSSTPPATTCRATPSSSSTPHGWRSGRRPGYRRETARSGP